MIEKILQSLEENAQSGGGRHSVRPLSLELAIEMKNASQADREDFEDALCQLGHASTPFTAPPNGLSPYQVTMLIGMGLELGLSEFGDIVAANLLLLGRSPNSHTIATREIRNFCVKFLRSIGYDNENFWIDLFQSDNSDITIKSVAAEMLCESRPDLVFSQFELIFSDKNPQSSALAWNIYSRIDAGSCFAETLASAENAANLELFLAAIDLADPSGAARSEIQNWIRVSGAENIVLFSHMDYRKVVNG